MKIYIVTPPSYKTGGTELLFQLAHWINLKGGDATIAFESSGDGTPLVPSFRCYVDKFVFYDQVQFENAFFIIPEGRLNSVHIADVKHAAVFWESVDNCPYAFPNFGIRRDRLGFIKAVVQSLFPWREFRRDEKKHISSFYLHLYQSEYAKRFITRNKLGNNVAPLSDYVNDEFLHAEENGPHRRNDTVLYNPKKGGTLLQQTMRRCPDICFIPLEKMSGSELRDVMLSSKVYVDFGPHPGKDRLPREAALMGCIVITNKCGSARYYDDVPLPGRYKISTVKNACQAIRYSLSNYQDCYHELSFYREEIRSQKEKFLREVGDLLSKIEDAT